MTGVPAGVDLPDLRIVAHTALALHEDADERRVAALVHQLAADGVVKNPPIVTPLGGQRFVVLDGANRATALCQLGVRDVVVQVVDYAEVTLSTWFHLVVGMGADGLIAALRGVPALELAETTLAAARADLAARHSIGYIATPDGPVRQLVGGASLGDQTALLGRVVGTYRGRARIHRVQSDEVDALRSLYRDIGGLVVFPGYGPADILAMVEQSAKLPSGITRHVIARRALRLNLDLGVLRADTDLVDKNRWLVAWLRGRVQAGHVRFYEEPTVMFDE